MPVHPFARRGGPRRARSARARFRGHAEGGRLTTDGLSARRARLVIAGLALFAPLAWAALSPPGRNDLVGGDEGYYATMARNIVADPAQALTVSRHPLGAPGDKPPGYPLLLAGCIRAFGFSEAALRWPSFVLAGCVLLCTGLFALRIAGGRAALATTLVLATLPWFADASRVVAAELPLAACGTAALAFAMPGMGAARAFAAGALLGLGFACKLWLVAPFGLAVLAAAWPWRSFRVPLALAAGFALAGGAHPVLVALRAPAQWDHWFDVYWRFSFRDRVGGEGYASYWRHPPDFYARMLLRAFALASPLLAFGAVAAWRRRHEPGMRALAGWLAGPVLLSLFTIKSGGYAYPFVPALAVLVGVGSAALARRVPGLGWLLVALAAGGGAVRIGQRLSQPYHVPGYADVARVLAPHLAAVPADSVAVLAPEAPAFEAYLFRRARYWDSPYDPWTAGRLAALAAGGGATAFVTDSERRFYGGGPDAATMAWLIANTDELTGTVQRPPGRPLGVRVFVRRGTAGGAGVEPARALR